MKKQPQNANNHSEMKGLSEEEPLSPDHQQVADRYGRRNASSLDDVGKLTAEAIRANGLKVAENIREFARKAKAEGEATVAFAEEVASAIVDAADHAAARITNYMERCDAASASMQQHKSLLNKLPDKQAKIAANSKPVTDLDLLERQIAGTASLAQPEAKPEGS